jgi:type IV pilus assembly protein PilP
MNRALFKIILACLPFAVGAVATHVRAQEESAPPPPPPPPPGDVGAGAEEGAGQSDGAGLSSELESFLEPYIYDPKGRRDPFLPFVETKPLQEGELAGPLLPLQQFDLEQLKLVGIIWNVNDPKAMFTDPQNQVHVVRRDERIGRKNGYIAVIREGEVVVVEAVNVNGDLMYSTRVLKIAGRSDRDSR